MTKKSAKKTAARARQAKTGQPYQSALRAEGGGNADYEKRCQEAFLVLNSGLYHGGVNAPTRETLFARIQSALHILAGSIDKPSGTDKPPCTNCGATMYPKPETGEGWWACPLCNAHQQPFEAESALTPKTLGGFTLVPTSVDYKLVPNIREPEKLMDFWKPVEEAKRCANSKQLLVGVTDDHPEKPLVTWTSLARMMRCPEFADWWRALPESSHYDRAQGENRIDVMETIMTPKPKGP